MAVDESLGRLNLLMAYPYVRANALAIIAEHAATTRFLLDSGAFTAWKAGKAIKLDDYCKFLDALIESPARPWRYFTLDVIGDPKATLANYDAMLRRGYSPVPIFTRGEDPSVLEHYYATSDVVGIGGLVGTQGNKGFVNGIMRLVGQRKVHWLGFTQVDFLRAYRPYMCDSSSWASALMYKAMKLYDHNGRAVVLSKHQMKRPPKPEVAALLREFGIPLTALATERAWINTSKGINAIEHATFRSFVRYQRDVERHLGTKLFMAVIDDGQIRLALAAREFWANRRAARPAVLQETPDV